METKESQISVHALSGCQSFETMRVTGLHGKTSLHILIDSDSTHNFLDISIARKLGCKLEAIPTQSITVADGYKLQCLYICRGFKWQMHNAHFEADMLIIPLGSCDIILGIQWLSQLITMRWNFNKLHMEFTYEGRDHILRGLKGKKFLMMNKGQLHKILAHNPQLCMLQIVSNKGEGQEFYSLQGVSMETRHNAHLEELLSQYADIFEEPNSLPPRRGFFDHKIPLAQGINPFSIRPYRYPLRQKDIIESLI